MTNMGTMKYYPNYEQNNIFNQNLEGEYAEGEEGEPHFGPEEEKQEVNENVEAEMMMSNHPQGIDPERVSADRCQPFPGGVRFGLSRFCDRSDIKPCAGAGSGGNSALLYCGNRHACVRQRLFQHGRRICHDTDRREDGSGHHEEPEDLADRPDRICARGCRDDCGAGPAGSGDAGAVHSGEGAYLRCRGRRGLLPCDRSSAYVFLRCAE